MSATDQRVFASIDEAIAEIKAGRMVVVCDDEDRENEGDIVMAAQFVTPEAINFMAKEARGWICLALTAERCDELRLRSEEHTSELQSRQYLVCRLLLEKTTSIRKISCLPTRY